MWICFYTILSNTKIKKSSILQEEQSEHESMPHEDQHSILDEDDYHFDDFIDDTGFPGSEGDNNEVRLNFKY